MRKLIYSAHFLNLDTAIGAVITSHFVNSILGVTMENEVSVMLFLSVLAIYNFDHLVDSYHIHGKAMTTRHDFYKTNRRGLWLWQLIVVIVLLLLLPRLPHRIIINGTILTTVVGIYFMLIWLVTNRYIFFKEIMVALIYTLAIFIVPLSQYQFGSPVLTKVLFYGTFSCAVGNLLVFSYYDLKVDKAENHASLVRLIGRSKIRIGVMLILVMAFIFYLVYFDLFYHPLAPIILIIMIALLIVLLLFPKTFMKNDLYRLVGEYVFLIPIFYLIFNG